MLLGDLANRGNFAFRPGTTLEPGFQKVSQSIILGHGISMGRVAFVLESLPELHPSRN
jgi:hypothetical protein